MKHVIFLIFLSCCTASQRNWKENTYIDVSTGGTTTSVKDTFLSTGLSYPVTKNLWGSVGVWSDFVTSWGPYWGLSYSWAPFAKGE